jgi:tetratricopeptide (TPR) repeat protein
MFEKCILCNYMPILEKAIRLNPHPPAWYFINLGYAYEYSGRHEEAIRAFKRVLETAPNYHEAFVGLTTAYVHMDRLEEARAAAKDVLRANPKFSVEQYGRMGPIKDRSILNQQAEALRNAGLK